jgi:Alanyl-tRNA synthetase
MIKLDDKTEFLGYKLTESSGKVIAIFQDGNKVDAINAGDTAVVILDKTPFYGESGGQVGYRNCHLRQNTILW